MTPLFDLKGYFFPSFFCQSIPEYKKKKHEEPKLLIETDLTEIRDGLWYLMLLIETPDEMPVGSFPYDFRIHTYGLIETDNEILESDPVLHIKLLYVNGASLLYSAARERLALFCSSPLVDYTYFLPTYRFDPADVDKMGIIEKKQQKIATEFAGGVKPKQRKSRAKNKTLSI